MKTKEKEICMSLRKEQGMSIRNIAQKVGVAKSSVSLWVRDIQLTKKQKRLLKQNDIRYGAHTRGSEVWSRMNSEKRKEWQEEGRTLARQKDLQHMAGCMLYWAEGHKSKNQLVFCNSDPMMLRLFVDFLKDSYSVKPEDIVVNVLYHTDNQRTLKAVHEYWLRLLNLPKASLRKCIARVPVSSKRKKRKLEYGVCYVRLKNATHVLQSILGAIQEYANFERDAWLYSMSHIRTEKPKTMAR